MALSPCRECGHEVSSEAAACPSCGVPDPSRTNVVAGACVGCGEHISVSPDDNCPHCGVQDPLTPRQPQSSGAKPPEQKTAKTVLRVLLYSLLLYAVFAVFRVYDAETRLDAVSEPPAAEVVPQATPLARSLAPRCPDADAPALDRMATRGARTLREKDVLYRDAFVVVPEYLLEELETALEGFSTSPQDCSTMMATIMVMIEQGVGG